MNLQDVRMWINTYRNLGFSVLATVGHVARTINTFAREQEKSGFFEVLVTWQETEMLEERR